MLEENTQACKQSSHFAQARKPGLLSSHATSVSFLWMTTSTVPLTVQSCTTLYTPEDKQYHGLSDESQEMLGPLRSWTIGSWLEKSAACFSDTLHRTAFPSHSQMCGHRWESILGVCAYTHGIGATGVWQKEFWCKILRIQRLASALHLFSGWSQRNHPAFPSFAALLWNRRLEVDDFTHTQSSMWHVRTFQTFPFHR